MEFTTYFPVWDKLTELQQKRLAQFVREKTAKKNTLIHTGTIDCMGPLLIKSGQLRVYTISEDGREMTLYRLFDRDLCIFSASCVMSSAQFDITIEAEKDSEYYVIPADIFKELMQESASLSNYTNQIMASRFSDVMWLMEQIMWKSFDKRLASFLLEESVIEDSDVLKITHEKIGHHLGNPREVVTRMLRYFQNEGMVALTRGTITLIDKKKLAKLEE